MNDSSSVNMKILQKKSWSEQELQNAHLVADFVDHLMNKHDFEYILKKYGKGPYRQHNRSMTDGVTGVIDYVRTLTKRFPEFSYDVKYIHADGEYVILHSHATMSTKDRGNQKRGFIIYDTWKITNGEIVEHWDALQPLDLSMRLFSLFAGGSIKNKNGLF